MSSELDTELNGFAEGTALIEEHEHDSIIPEGWTNPPSLELLQNDFTNAKEDQNDHIAKVSSWLRALEGKPSAALAKASKKRSKYVDKLIRKQAELRYPALSEPFLDDDTLFNINATTKADIEAAKQNQLVLNYQFNNEIDKIAFIDEYVHTAVNEGSVAVRVGWEYKSEMQEKEKPVYEFYVDNSPEHIESIQQLVQFAQTEPAQFKLTVEEPIQEALKRSLTEGVPYNVKIIGSEIVEEEVIVKNHPTVKVVNYNNYVIDPACGGDIKKAKFVGFAYETSLSELEESGIYSNLDKIQHTSNPDPQGDVDEESKADRSAFIFQDAPRKTIMMHEYWGYYDYDNSGVIKPFVAAWVGSTLIRLEENPYPKQFLPLVHVKYNLGPNIDGKSLFGEAEAEIIEDNQKITSALSRGMIDLLARSANSQQGYAKNFLDANNRRRFMNGQDYEFNPNIDPRAGVHMHEYPSISPSAFDLLSLHTRNAETLTGTSSKAVDIKQGKGTFPNGLPNPIDNTSQRESSILRRLVKGVEEIGKMILAMNAEFLEEEKVIRITNEEFVNIQREDLEGNFNLKVSVTTAAENNQRASELSFMLQTVGPKIESKVTYYIMAQIARLRKMPALADFLEDYEPQPDPIEEEKRKLENDLLAAKADNERAWAANRRADAQKTLADARVKSSDADLKDLEYVEEENGTKHMRDVDRITSQARAQSEGKIKEAIINKQLNPDPIKTQPTN